MRGYTKERYISNIDESRNSVELEGMGLQAENVALDFFRHMGLEARISTAEEDSGRRDIGPKPVIDGVVYRDQKPIMPFQLTTSKSPKFRQEKMAQLQEKPFVRLPEMKTTDPAIPKTLIYMDAEAAKRFQQNPDFSKHPELALQIINSAVSSLQFDLLRTENPIEQKAVQELIQMFEQEKRKYIH